jgi:hypothetical protein
MGGTLTDCEHDVDAFQRGYETPTAAWTRGECALCMLRLLDAMLRKYSCYPAATDILRKEEFLQISRAIRTFASLVAAGEFDSDPIQEQVVSFHPADTPDLDMATALERAISILTQEERIAVARARIKLRNELPSLDSNESQKVDDLATQLDNAGRKSSNELLKQYAVSLRELMPVNPCYLFQFVIGVGVTR